MHQSSDDPKTSAHWHGDDPNVAWCMQKCLHVTPEMHAIYIPHEFQKTNLKWSRHHLQLMEYKFLKIILYKTLHNKRLDLLMASLLALSVQPPT
jgi:hypothetical protein